MSSAGLSLQIDPAKRLEKRNKAQVGIQEDEMNRRMNIFLHGLLALCCGTALAAEDGRILKLDFLPGKNRATLTITHAGDGKFRLFKVEKQSRLIIEAENLSLPPSLSKVLSAKEIDSPALSLTPYGSQRSGRPMAKLVVHLRGAVDTVATEIPGKYVLEIIHKASSPNVVARADDSIKSRSAANQKGDEAAKKLVEVLSLPPDEKHYFGDPVSFEAKDAEVPDIFRLVGESSGLNIVWDSDVEKEKTSLAVKDLPWDQLLDIVVQQKGYKATVMGNVVRIMTIDTFNKQAEAKKKEKIGRAHV